MIDDRVLNHAYARFDGMPSVVMHKANQMVPEELLKDLNQLITAS